MSERWLPVAGFENRYEVSDLGRVRSLQFRGHNRVQVMKASENYSGYLVVTLGPKRQQFRLHCLVLETFVGPRPEGQQGCHNDGNKANNALSNLRWDTPSGNCADRRDYSGQRNPNAKLSDEERFAVAQLVSKGDMTRSQIAKQFNITCTRVSQIHKEHEMDNWVVITSTNCPGCVTVKQILAANDVEYTEIPAQSKEGLDYLRSMGVRSVPQVIRNGGLVGGLDAVKLFFAA